MSVRKTIYVAHPISGDLEGNQKKVLAICEEIHRQGVIPVAPYLVSLQYFNDDIQEDRELGIEASLEHFRRGFVDELWLYGDRISKGMWGEIRTAREHNVPVFAKTPETERDLEMGE